MSRLSLPQRTYLRERAILALRLSPGSTLHVRPEDVAALLDEIEELRAAVEGREVRRG